MTGSGGWQVVACLLVQVVSTSRTTNNLEIEQFVTEKLPGKLNVVGCVNLLRNYIDQILQGLGMAQAAVTERWP